jgi:CubicO group peptidase (beta-lactamase class C family)
VLGRLYQAPSRFDEAEADRQDVTTDFDHPTELVVFDYQNANFILAGAMLERCTGKSWEDLMKTEIFQPLGMTTAGFGAPGSGNDINEPWGHTDTSGTRVANKGDNTPGLGPGRHGARLAR